MVVSAQQELGKRSVEILDLVLRIYSDNCILASIRFSSLIRRLKRSADRIFVLVCHLQTIHQCNF